jgi:hypothetical protein
MGGDFIIFWGVLFTDIQILFLFCFSNFCSFSCHPTQPVGIPPKQKPKMNGSSYFTIIPLVTLAYSSLRPLMCLSFPFSLAFLFF